MKQVAHRYWIRGKRENEKDIILARAEAIEGDGPPDLCEIGVFDSGWKIVYIERDELRKFCEAFIAMDDQITAEHSKDK